MPEALSPWVAIPAALIGFVLGWLSAWLTERVTPREEAPSIRWRSLLIRDPLVQGALALIWAAIPLLIPGDVIHWLEAGLLSVPLVQVAVTDLRTRYVYTAIAGIGLVLGLAMGWDYHQVAWFWTVIGGAGGAIVFIGLYWLGRLVFRQEAMARGDITIAAMVGAGAASLAAYALFYGIVASGVLALLYWAITRSRHSYMPYGPGLCVGGLITLFMR
jgi:prepilin signal peptidase PulO-like enzyme (type II secretory pathway)